MRLTIALAAILTLTGAPVLAQEISKARPSVQKSQAGQSQPQGPQRQVPGDDPAQTAEARRLTADVLAADRATEARNAQAQANYEAARADYQARLAANTAARNKYEADLAAQRAAQQQYERDHAAWEARVKACQAGDSSQCEHP
jgi:hypothetical protein